MLLRCLETPSHNPFEILKRCFSGKQSVILAISLVVEKKRMLREISNITLQLIKIHWREWKNDYICVQSVTANGHRQVNVCTNRHPTEIEKHVFRSKEVIQPLSIQ